MVKRFAGRPFALLGINSDGPREAVLDRLREAGLPWRNALDGSPGAITTEWNVRVMPMLYILDAEGVILTRGDLSDNTLDSIVREALDAMPPPK